MSAALPIAGLVGAIVGAIVTYLWRFSERQQHTVDEPTHVVPPGAEMVLSVLSSSAVLIDSADTVVKASAPAFAMGIINDDRLEPDELMALVRQVRRDGIVREADISLQPKHGTTSYIHARVAPLTSRLILVLADDRTREHRVESIRRDFVANVSHELKTPVGALNLLAEAVGEAKDDPEAVVRFSGRMHLESERLTRLVQQIIDLSRLQNDILSDDATAIKVGELVSEACEHSATDAEHKDIEIVSSVEPDLQVHGDRAQLHAAVSNLVENAVTYSPARLDRHPTDRDRQRHRHPQPGARPDLRAVLPRRSRPSPRDGRHGPRPVDRQARRGQQRRHRRGVERTGSRLVVHPGAARLPP
jgi:two-component system sensor histidine kinase SenX3